MTLVISHFRPSPTNKPEDATMKNVTMTNSNNEIDQATKQNIDVRGSVVAHSVTSDGRSAQNDPKMTVAKREWHGSLKDLFTGKCNFITL